MRLLKAKALALAAVGLAWYAVGGTRLVAKRAAVAVLDCLIGPPKKRSEPRPPTR